MDGRIDGWMDRWMDGWIDGWMDDITIEVLPPALRILLTLAILIKEESRAGNPYGVC